MFCLLHPATPHFVGLEHGLSRSSPTLNVHGAAVVCTAVGYYKRYFGHVQFGSRPGVEVNS